MGLYLQERVQQNRECRIEESEYLDLEGGQTNPQESLLTLVSTFLGIFLFSLGSFPPSRGTVLSCQARSTSLLLCALRRERLDHHQQRTWRGYGGVFSYVCC